MRFYIEATSCYSDNELIKKFPILKDYKLQTVDKYTTVEIGDFQELFKLIDKIGFGVIINRASYRDRFGEPRLEIYDDFREF